jgi:hypothetical protein
MQNDPLSAFVPKKFGRKEEEPAAHGELEDDDYEIEEPMGNDALMAMMPMSFGKQDRKKDFTADFAKTKRVVC